MLESPLRETCILPSFLLTGVNQGNWIGTDECLVFRKAFSNTHLGSGGGIM